MKKVEMAKKYICKCENFLPFEGANSFETNLFVTYILGSCKFRKGVSIEFDTWNGKNVSHLQVPKSFHICK